jgi:hypothetical protein
MLSTELDINLLTFFIGAPINGVDLRCSDEVLIGQIQNVLQQYSVVFFEINQHSHQLSTVPLPMLSVRFTFTPQLPGDLTFLAY